MFVYSPSKDITFVTSSFSLSKKTRLFDDDNDLSG
jgi:hypothetical protein